MKKIIKGKSYNSNTAREVGFYEWPYLGDYCYFVETLYCKRTGEYFIHGQGGELSRYAQHTGQNNWCDGEDIIPMEYDNAKKWAETYLEPEKYEAEFGV